MSGLALFFRDHMQTDRVKTYHTSLLESQPLSNQSNQNKSPWSHFVGQTNYREWKRARNQLLRTYSYHRLVHIDTKKQQKVTIDHSNLLLDDILKRFRHDVNYTEERFITPHIQLTHHQAERIEDIDLMASSVSLMVCHVEKFWPFRDLHRMKLSCNPTDETSSSLSSVLSQPMYLHFSEPQFPRLTIGGFQEDGPLASGYDHVLNMEVTQIVDEKRLLRQHAEYQEDYVGAKRIHVFFYGNYATSLESILRKKKTNDMIWLSLQSIPNKCVIPYAPAGWFDAYDLSSTCLCIADESSTIKIVDENNQQTKLRFDRFDMELFIATGSSSQHIEHIYRISPRQTDGVLIESMKVENSPFALLSKQLHVTKIPSPLLVYEKIVSITFYLLW